MKLALQTSNFKLSAVQRQLASDQYFLGDMWFPVFVWLKRSCLGLTYVLSSF